MVRQRIDRAGERLWRLEDFRDLPFYAVAQILSRLTREGAIERLSKGCLFSQPGNGIRQEPTKSRRDPETREED